MEAISKAIEAVKSKFPDTVIRLDEPMKKHTSFKIGGPVRMMIFPNNISCFTGICDILGNLSIAPFILGNGSNVLADDKKLDLVVINTLSINSISFCDTETPDPQKYKNIMVDAGVPLSKLAMFACDNGLTGLEFAHGIPGTLGGAVVMNAGAYGSEIKDIVLSTDVYGKTLGTFTLTAADNDFSYRQSRFTTTDEIVLSAIIRLSYGIKDEIKQKMNELDRRRRESQPLDQPSGGSTFKRPKEGYAAALIEQAGLKGYTVGGAKVSEKHTGFVVNTGNAAFSDVLAVIDHIRDVVFNRFNIRLEPEIKILR